MPCLAFNLNDGNEFIFDLVEPRLSLGRHSRNEIAIDNPELSEFHAELLRLPDGGYEVVDLTSSNGTFVNGSRVERATLRTGDSVRFGALDACLRETGPPGPATILPDGAGLKGGAARRETPPHGNGNGNGTAKKETASIFVPSRKTSKIPLAVINMKAGRATVTQGPADEGGKSGTVEPNQPEGIPTTTTVPRATIPLGPVPKAPLSHIAVKTSSNGSPPDDTSQNSRNGAHTAGDSLARQKAQEQERAASVAGEELAGLQARIAEHRGTEQRLRERLERESQVGEEHLASLAREIREAEERLTVVTKDLSGRERHAETLVGAASTRLEDLNASVASMQTRQKEAEESVARICAERATREKELAEVSARLDMAQAGMAASLSRQRESELRAQEAETRAREAEGRFQRTTGELAAADQKLSALQQELAASRTKLLAARETAQQETAQQETAQLDLRRREAEQALTAREEQLQALEVRVAEHEARRNASETRLVELAATDSRLASATEALKLVQEQQTAAEVALARLRTQREQDTADAAEATARLESLSLKQAELDARMDASQRELAAQEKRLSQTLAASARAESAGETRRVELDRAHAERVALLEKAASAVEERTREMAPRLQAQEQEEAALQRRVSELRQVEAQLLEARPKLEAVESRRSELEAELTTLSTQIHERTREVAELTARISSQETGLKELAAREREMQDAIRALRESGDSERSRFEGMRSLAADGERIMGARRAELERSVADMESAARTVEDRLEQLRRQESEVMRKLEDLSSTDSRLQDATEALHAVDEQRARVEALLVTLGQEREEREVEISALTEKGKAQHLLVQTLSRQAVALEENVDSLQRTTEEGRKALADIEAKSAGVEARIGTRIEEAEKILAELSELTAAEIRKRDAAQAQLADLQEDLEALRGTDAKLAEVRQHLFDSLAQQGEVEGHLARLARLTEGQQEQLSQLTAHALEKEQDVQRATDQLARLGAELTRLASQEGAQRKLVAQHTLEAQQTAEALLHLQVELTGVEDQVASATKRRYDLERELAELADTNHRLASSREELRGVDRQVVEEKLKLADTVQEKIETDQQLASLRQAVEGHQQQVELLLRQHEEASKEIERAQERAEAEDHKAMGIRQEISMLVNAAAARQSEYEEGERNLEALRSRLVPAEKRFADLQNLENRIREAQIALKATEKAREAEERTVVDFEKVREKLRREVTSLAAEEKANRARTEEAARRAHAEENRFADTHKRAEKASLMLATIEARRIEAENYIKSARDEAAAIRAGMPAIAGELARAQQELQHYLAERDREQSRARSLVQESIAAAKRCEAAAAQCANLETDRMSIERQIAALGLQQAQVEATILAMHSEGSDTQNQLAALQQRMQEREAAFAARTAEMGQHLETLRAEEESLNAAIRASRERLQREEMAGENLRRKLAAAEAHYSELLRNGDRILSVNEAMAQAEYRKREADRMLGTAAEQELAVQVRLNGLHESIKRESQRFDMVRREREQFEDDARRAMEALRREFEDVKQRLNDELRREETHNATRLKERMADMHQKHDLLARGLAASMDEQTVILFAIDIIKRIDLIDILVQRYAAVEAHSGIEQQLRTLRASFEDILGQHGVSEYRVAPGTEVDVTLRTRIAIVENIAGPSRARVVESYRPGFTYTASGGREVILRKVEVKTSAQS